LFAWSLADILLITILIAWVPAEGPSLFMLFVLTTLFFGVASPLRDQLVLLFVTIACYVGLYLAGQTSVSPSDLIRRYGRRFRLA
jgi:hypothetical protein